MDRHQLVVPGPVKCDPHEEQSLGMKGTPAEEKHDHNGHQHPNQRPLPMWEIPGITMLIAITILKEKKNYSQFRPVSRTKGSHSRQREDYFQE